MMVSRALTVLWAGVLLWAGAVAALPTSLWLDVRSVEVDNTQHGHKPILKVERYISQNFNGRYTVDVEQMSEEGSFHVVCTASGRTNYRTDASFPDPLDLDWWTYPVKCDLAPGVYRIDTSWEITVGPFMPNKYTSMMSNVFIIS